MQAFQQSTTFLHEYRMKGVQRTILLVLGAAAIFGVIAVTAASVKDPNRPAPLLLAMFLAAFGTFMLASALRSRLIVDKDHIEVRGAIRESSAETRDIEGYRTISSRNGSFTKFYLKQGHGTLTMPNSFDIDDNYRAWLQRFPNLDQIDRDALLNEISQLQDLGATPEERLAALKQAKTCAILALVVACAAAVALNFGNPTLQAVFAIALALVPVILALMIQRSPLLYAVFKKKSDPRAELMYALIATSFGFLLRNRGTHLVSLQSLSLVIVFVSFAYCAAFFRSAHESSSPTSALIGLVFLAASYGYAMAATANNLADSSNATTYHVKITGKHVSRGRSTSYYLELEPWGPMQSQNSISVPRTTYDQFAPGDEICLNLHQGRLHAPWYAIVSCAPPSPDLVQ